MPRFVRRHDNGNIEIFSFNGVALVGRSRKNQVVLDDQSVSSSHAKVEPGPEGWTVWDLDSRNGTRINEAEVKSGKLKSGDQVRFGKILVVFEIDGEEAGKGAPAAAAAAPPAAAAGAPPAAAGPVAPPAFGHTMAPFEPATAVKVPDSRPPKGPESKGPAVAKPVAAPSPAAPPAAPAPAPAPAAPAAEKPALSDGAKMRAEQAELKIRILKDQVRGLQNQRVILTAVAAGLALMTIVFLVAMLMYRRTALEYEHGLRKPPGTEEK